MSKWLVTPWDHSASGMANESVIVEIDSMDEAASIGLRWLQEIWDEKNAEEQIQNVYVVSFDERVAFTRRLCVERSEFQCCGGPSKWSGEHYATCPEHGTRDEDEEDEPETAS